MRPIVLLLLCACAIPAEKLGGIDVDRDGFPWPSDCDGLNDDVHPGAAEICDGLDNNCDGQVDVDAVDATPRYPDHDGDGLEGLVVTTSPPSDLALVDAPGAEFGFAPGSTLLRDSTFVMFGNLPATPVSVAFDLVQKIDSHLVMRNYGGLLETG